MNWLKPLVVFGLLIAAAGIALATGLSNHNDDYGKVSLPQGATLHLPKGSATVFYEEVGQGSDPIAQAAVPVSFQVAPAGGGPYLPVTTTKGAAVQPDSSVQRSETIGELGAVARVQVPSDGLYTITGHSGRAPGVSYLTFGTNSGTALKNKWRLLAGLVAAALLATLIPVPRHRRKWDDEELSEWSSDPTAPYAPRAPYQG